jgi:hypothetical protein
MNISYYKVKNKVREAYKSSSDKDDENYNLCMSMEHVIKSWKYRLFNRIIDWNKNDKR